MMAAPQENVLVIKRSLFDRLGAFQGLNFEPERYLETLLSRGNNFFLSRTAAEVDPDYKQIIPYAILAHGDRVLYYVRGKKAGEQRLVDKGEAMITNLEFLTQDELLSRRDSLETWSQLCVEELKRLLV